MPTIPPPPPPLLPLKSENLKSYQNNNDSKNLDIVFKECVWCKDPEVKRACFFARTCCDTSPRECSYMRVKPILQSGKFICFFSEIKFFLGKKIILYLELGPTCGLTTLSMICCGSPTVDSLLDKAIELKYSNNGEMFSTQWLLELLNDNLQKSCARMPHRIRSYIYTGVLDSEFIREKLKQHSILIVPYDADVRNHEPCRMNGHKAHWTLVCGYLIDDFGDVSY